MAPEDVISVQASLEKWLTFGLVSLGVFAVTYGVLFVIDFLPEPPASVVSGSTSRTDELNTQLPSDAEEVSVTSVDPYPTRIIFDALDGRELPILNPESDSVEALDTALLSGVVRHPDAADFERVGTIFLFGHSSYLPNVVNKNFQAFNGIQKMVWGDTIRLQSSDTEYVYRVDRVYEASADEAEVKIETGKAKLTLVTCDSFGSKSDRFIVEATLLKSYPLEENVNGDQGA